MKASTSLAIRASLLLCLTFLVTSSTGSIREKSTLYEHFTTVEDETAISSGLKADNRNYFELNGKPLKILSGSLHYFRVHPDQWRDRLRKFRAAGLNTVDVYVPWNLHEPRRGEFDFGSGSSQFSPFLDLAKFLRMAREEDLFVLFRPGPYICAEWEFGGLPSWLLSEHPMFVRTSFESYQQRADIFLKRVVKEVKDLQFFTQNGQKGGPIIATQIENEYGNFGYTDWPRDTQHLLNLRAALVEAGIESLFFTSDSPLLVDDLGAVPGDLMTANFKYDSEPNLERLVYLQPDRPVLVTEYWTGWFDHWFSPQHNILPIEDFESILQRIFAYNGSVNMFMFHGGTNFGFMNGANIIDFGQGPVFPFYAAQVTSYDYDAPLSEHGNYTAKYNLAESLLQEHDPLSDVLIRPQRPDPPKVVKIDDVEVTEVIEYSDLVQAIDSSKVVESPTLLSMEQLDINSGNGQSYGYIIYRKKLNLENGQVLTFRGKPRDLLTVLINGIIVHEPILSAEDITKFGSWGLRDQKLQINLPDGVDCETEICTLDLMVENLGRVNFGKPHQFDQRKGLVEGPVLLDDEIVEDFEIIAMEMEAEFVANLDIWTPVNNVDNLDKNEENIWKPKMLRGKTTLSEISDTFFSFGCEKCQNWKHGILFVNGFNVGRYHNAGPQQTLYIPQPLLIQGENEFVVFDLYRGDSVLRFADRPEYGPEGIPTFP